MGVRVRRLGIVMPTYRAWYAHVPGLDTRTPGIGIKRVEEVEKESLFGARRQERATSLRQAEREREREATRGMLWGCRVHLFDDFIAF